MPMLFVHNKNVSGNAFFLVTLTIQLARHVGSKIPALGPYDICKRYYDYKFEKTTNDSLDLNTLKSK